MGAAGFGELRCHNRTHPEVRPVRQTRDKAGGKHCEVAVRKDCERVTRKDKARKNKKKGLKREFPAEKDHENNARADA